MEVLISEITLPSVELVETGAKTVDTLSSRELSTSFVGSGRRTSASELRISYKRDVDVDPGA